MSYGCGGEESVVMEREAIGRNEARSDVSERAKGFSDQAVDVWRQALEATDAQLSVSVLRVTRLMVIGAFCGTAIIALGALAGYGFWLLDGCLAYVLSRPSMPVWLAPLVRGSIYLGASLATLWYGWKTMDGVGADAGAGAAVAGLVPR